MNICMFTNTYLPHVGGVARSVHFFSEDLRRRGHNVLVVAPTFQEPDKMYGEDGFTLRVPAIQKFNGSDFSVRIPIPFLIDEEIDRFQPELIHSHHPFLLGDAAIRAAHRRNLPLVFTHHTLYEEYSHYVSSDSKIMKQLAINLATEYANLCTRVVAPSESIASLIAGRGVSTPIEVIPTGVDVRKFQQGNGKLFRDSNNIPADATVIGHLGRLAPEKNLDYLCHAVIDLLQKHSANLYFLVIGSGPSELEIVELFNESKLSDRLVMAGEQKGDDLINGYNAMDIFVFSSQTETQGMVLIEAMASSLPVIALDGSGVREVVRDDVNGKLLPADASTEAFSASIHSAVKDADTCKRWREEARRTAEKYSRKRSSDKLENFYYSLQEIDRQNYIAVSSNTDLLDGVIASLEVEWVLLSEKANALINTVKPKFTKADQK